MIRVVEHEALRTHVIFGLSNSEETARDTSLMLDIYHSFNRMLLAVLELVRLMISKDRSNRVTVIMRTFLVFDIDHIPGSMLLAVLELVRLMISKVSAFRAVFGRALSRHDIDISSLENSISIYILR